MNNNLYCALRDAFPKDIDQTAIETADGEPLFYTWRDLDRSSAMIANLFQSLDLPADSRVLVQTDKSVETLILYLAVLRAGLVYVPLNSAYQASELEYFIGNAEPAVVVCASRDFGWISKIAFRAGTQHTYTLDDDRSGSLLQRAAHHSGQQVPVPRTSADVATIIYTSGTTGRSKGAMLSHGNLLSNAQVLKTLWGWRSAAEGGDVLIHALPLFHVHGLFVASHGALLNGSKMLWFAKFDARAVTARLPEATVFMGVPTLYVRLLAEPSFGAVACRNMRLFISGSAPLLAETFRQFSERTGHTILERYGMSETVMLTSNPNTTSPEAPPLGRIAGTVGFALPGVDLRISGDGGSLCQPGEIGAVEVRGPSIFQGYWRMPEKTAEEFSADGWFKTGDVGHLDSHGRLTLIGRSKDLIISGGYNVYPAEVEGYLNELPGVDESAVIGVPHPDFGEAVVAVLVPRAGSTVDPQACIAALKQRIAGFKVPKQVTLADHLPRNAMGKVQKALLREQHRAAFAG
ncbi:MAG: malonyl-CoA synthase [Burkholderiaceae bacterium]|nr:malonyl-CoA synthase [Burkholderiaceae bacterium]